ncbi:MAG TPA: DUF4388 domain-containing protein [Ktedonobacterales bacterium]|nr:DUF4388 domain-containing protein [Ktedonobacterales bacterium]
MAARFVLTSRLSNIIQMITLSRQSGILRVARGQGALREMGQIRFVRGEPIAALLGETTGGGALNALANWGECAYAFDETFDADDASDPSMGTGAFGADSPPPPYPPSQTPNSSGSSSSWPSSYGYLNVPPTGGYPPPNDGGAYQGYGGYDTGYPGYPPRPSEAPPNGYGAPPGYRAPERQDRYGGMERQDRMRPNPGYSRPLPNLPHLGNLPNLGGFGSPSYPGDSGSLTPQTTPSPMPSMPSPPSYAPSATPGQPSVSTYSTYTLQPEMLAAIPVRTDIAMNVEQLPLDRRERMVLLLVDGQRSVSDLIRLTRRSEQELYAVLRHLHMLGLVRM